jgi:hypothetical protein
MLGRLGEKVEGEVRPMAVMAKAACGGELLARARMKGVGFIGADTRGRAVRRPPMATGVTTWAARRLVTCTRLTANGGRRCGLCRSGMCTAAA